MTPLYYAVSAILLGWRWVIGQSGLLAGGWVWALSIVALTITIRVLLIPLFVAQVRASRSMQLLQPQLEELEQAYGHDRKRLAEEQKKVWNAAGVNPFGSLIPLILQMPIFLALFLMLDSASRGIPRGFLSDADVVSLKESVFMGGRIADTFTDSVHLETKFVAVMLILTIGVAVFAEMRHSMTRSVERTDPYVQQQKILLYMLPIVFVVSGLAFPMGVLIYFTADSLWSVVQERHYS